MSALLIGRICMAPATIPGRLLILQNVLTRTERQLRYTSILEL